MLKPAGAGGSDGRPESATHPEVEWGVGGDPSTSLMRGAEARSCTKPAGVGVAPTGGPGRKLQPIQ
jgi:hypothetical protein